MATPLSAYQESPKRTVFQNQEEGEQIILLLRQHPIVNLSWVTLSFLGVILPLVVSFLFDFLKVPLGEVLPVAFQPLIVTTYYMMLLAWAHLSFLSWYFNVYLVTNRRVVDLDYWGFLFFRFSAATIAHIEDVTYTVRGGWGVFFNYGDLYIQTAGTEANFDFLRVPQPAKVSHVIMTLVKGGDSP